MRTLQQMESRDTSSKGGTNYDIPGIKPMAYGGI